MRKVCNRRGARVRSDRPRPTIRSRAMASNLAEFSASRCAGPARYCGQLVRSSRTASTLRAGAVDGDPEDDAALISTICVA